jgi:uncharacterized RDD family membrane protein YckC
MTTLFVPTSEGVELRHEIAGAGSRFAAGLLDGLILAGGYLALGLALLIPAAFDPTRFSRFVLGLLVGGAVLAVLAYHALFHALRGGQTPGKRALGIRVLSADGLPATTMQIVLRALLWPVDVILLVPASIGLILVAATSKHQRLGDLVAGTLVVRAPERGGGEPFGGRTWSALENKKLALTPGAAARLSPEDRAFLRDLIQRADLEPTLQRKLFVDAAKHYSERLGLGPFEDARTVIYELYLFAREHASTDAR